MKKTYEKKILRVEDIIQNDRYDIFILYVFNKFSEYKISYFDQLYNLVNRIYFESEEELASKNIYVNQTEKKIIVDENNRIIYGRNIIVNYLINDCIQIEVMCMSKTFDLNFALNVLQQKDYDFLNWIYLTRIKKEQFYCYILKGSLLLNYNIDKLDYKIYKELTVQGKNNILKLLKSKASKFEGNYVFLTEEKLEDADNYLISKFEDKICIANIVLNKNSMHLLNHGKPFKYMWYVKKVRQYEEILKLNMMEYSDFVIASSGIIGLYGMREPTDIDFITINNEYEKICNKYIDCHHHVIDTYGKSIEEIVLDPENYVYWGNIKFMSLEIVKCACECRRERTKKLDGLFIDYIYREKLPVLKLTLIRIEHWILRSYRETVKIFDKFKFKDKAKEKIHRFLYAIYCKIFK